MKVFSTLLMLLIPCVSVDAQEEMLPFWEEFKNLYRESIEQELLQQPIVLPKVPQVYSINDAEYRLVISETGAQGEVALSGRVLSGDPESIPLFGKEMAIQEVREMAGGTFLCSSDSDCLAFLPEAKAGEFHLAATFLSRRLEENGIQAICFAIPPAARNSLHLILPEGARLAEPPGIADADGTFHFSPRSQLNVRYIDNKSSPSVIEMDIFTRFRIERNRMMMSVGLQPMRPAPESVALHVPPEMHYAASSLTDSRLKETAEGHYTITFPQNEQTPFSIDFAMDGRMDGGEISLALPFIENNTGAEDRFVVEEPDEGQVSIAADGLISQIPIEKLGEVLAATVSNTLFFMKAPPATPVRLTYTPFQTVSTPATVLASQEIFVSFSENGAVLTILRLEAPAEMGARMKIKAIEDMEIWSLTVNTVKQSIYTDDEKCWIIPLDGSQPSIIELALLRQGPKLSLQGTLEAVMPETGLPSRELNVGIALPPRVDLLSLDGPVSPASGDQWQPPAEFLGKPHFFSRSFYKGEGMTMSIAYKEPVNQNLQPQGEKP